MPPLPFIQNPKGGPKTMATKAQMYAQMADHAAVQLTSSWNEWMRFLDTASRLYKDVCCKG